MYIKQIVLQGFKSYKDLTDIEPFSPAHNVVVGRNGSGKSNFFWAVRFVLCDAYDNPSAQERQALLHDGNSLQTSSGFVEIVFENSDKRFPVDKAEVRLRRTIGINKDEYTIDGKISPRSKVLNFLESAGFSRHNPYYIVPQGRISSLTNAKDSDRLKLFKEIAGTGAYEERRAESLRIIEETNTKRARIEESLKQIQERLNELEEEKEHLKEYQELDSQRRYIEYIIHSQELYEIKENIQVLEDARKDSSAEVSILSKSISDARATIDSGNAEIGYLKNKINIRNAEKERMAQFIQKSLKNKASIEMNLTDLENKEKQGEDLSEILTGRLRMLESEIADKEKTLNEVTLQLSVELEAELEAIANLEKIEGEYTRGNPNSAPKFKSKIQRDSHIREEMNSVKRIRNLHASTIKSSEEKLTHYNEKKAILSQKLSSSESDIVSVETSLMNANKELSSKKEKLSQLNQKCREIWRNKNKSNLDLQSIAKELDKSNFVLNSLVDRDSSKGLNTLRDIISSENIPGYHGPLFKLFEADSVYDACIDTAIGRKMFNIVVDTVETATYLIGKIQSSQGRLTFLPMDRITVKEFQFEDTSDAISLIKWLKYDKKFEKIFKHLLSGVVVCPNIEIASKYVQNYEVPMAVSLSGDRADSKGYISGGYKEYSKSLRAAIRKQAELSAKYTEREEELNSLSNESKTLEQEMSSLRNEIFSIEREHMLLCTKLETLKLYCSKTRAEICELDSLINTEASLLNASKADLESTNLKIRLFEEELAAPFNVFSNESNNTTISDLEKAKADVLSAKKRRRECESLKSSLSAEIFENLHRQREDLRSELQSKPRHLDSKNAYDANNEYSNIGSEIKNNQNTFDEMCAEISKLMHQLNSKIQEVKLVKDECEKMEIKLEHLASEVEKCMLKRSNLLSSKEEITSRIKTFGLLPGTSFKEYENKSEPELIEILRNINVQLKKYKYANKNAFEQYHSFTRQCEDLCKRKLELDSSSKAIRNLLIDLDHRKSEAISRTLKQVCSCFSEVWKKLVPTGKGKLIPLRALGTASPSQDFDEETSMGSLNNSSETQLGGMVGASSSPGSNMEKNSRGIELYTGVSIQVSFNSEQEEGLRINQLSGGQKSLVALALIFAIQKCDPAPFYLFDEIDAALDPNYRVSVANVIHQLSRSAQFITTTFHPELLHRANQFYGVSFSGKISNIKKITFEEAMTFVEELPIQAS